MKQYKKALGILLYLLLRYFLSSLSELSSLELELEEPELELSELNPVGFEGSMVSATAATSGLSLYNILNTNEPEHNKTKKMACAPRENSDQPGHLPSLIRVFAVCSMGSFTDPSFLHADSKDSDQTGRMSRLNWVFAGHTCHFVGSVAHWLKYSWLWLSQILITKNYCFSQTKLRTTFVMFAISCSLHSNYKNSGLSNFEITSWL